MEASPILCNSGQVKAIISRTAKSATQSGAGRNVWLIQLVSATLPCQSQSFIYRVMGWVGTTSTLNQVKIKAATLQEAKSYCKKHGLAYEVHSNEARAPKRPKSYTDNFTAPLI